MISHQKSARALLGVAVWATLAVAPAAAAPPPPGPDDVERLDLLVVDAAGAALDGSGSATGFGVELEGEDECPGDSAHDQYRVDSYMIPLDMDPTDLVFTAQGPTPPAFRAYEGFQMPLYKLNKNPYAAQLTNRQREPGGPGPIPELPPFDFSVYTPTPGIEDYEGGLPAGTYRIGLACTFAGRITNLWETTIELRQDPADVPVGIAWTVTGPQPRHLEAAPAGSSPLVYGLVAVAAGSAFLAYRLQRSSRRRARAPEASPQESPA